MTTRIDSVLTTFDQGMSRIEASMSRFEGTLLKFIELQYPSLAAEANQILAANHTYDSEMGTDHQIEVNANPLSVPTTTVVTPGEDQASGEARNDGGEIQKPPERVQRANENARLEVQPLAWLARKIAAPANDGQRAQVAADHSRVTQVPSTEPCHVTTSGGTLSTAAGGSEYRIEVRASRSGKGAAGEGPDWGGWDPGGGEMRLKNNYYYYEHLEDKVFFREGSNVRPIFMG